MKSNKKCSMLYLLSLFIISCVAQQNTKILQKKYEISEITSVFEMKIIDYVPSSECGTRAFASMCLGKMITGDTIRVLSLCNTDTTFRTEQIVQVIPGRKPKFEVSTGALISKSGHIINNNEFKTIFGRIIKK